MDAPRDKTKSRIAPSLGEETLTLEIISRPKSTLNQ